MTIPQNVKDAIANVDACRLHTFDADWLTIRAHLLSQDAEIERLSQESAQQFIRARDWAELSGKNEDRASLAESRLAAANALLRDIKDWDVNQAQGTCLMVPLNLRKRIQAHLSENTHDHA